MSFVRRSEYSIVSAITFFVALYGIGVGEAGTKDSMKVPHPSPSLYPADYPHPAVHPVVRPTVHPWNIVHPMHPQYVVRHQYVTYPRRALRVTRISTVRPTATGSRARGLHWNRPNYKRHQPIRNVLRFLFVPRIRRH